MNEMTYLKKLQECVATYDAPPTCGTILQLVQAVDKQAHRLCNDNYFSSSALFDDFYESKINCCNKAL